ncbi:MAG: Rho termination factor N-terminal domain-containing protein [Acidobacteria bacterium]|nr:Rho termination factor N-terminal domain-containing protein [Acidobacteriota bacterium]
MAHTYEELKHKTVAQLREIAQGIEHDAVKGYTQLNKEHLIIAICKALNIDTHQHHHVEGINKAAVKSKLKALKAQRDDALAKHDHQQLKDVRRQMHDLKVKLHRATV